jgi:hypothetical protein
VRKQRKLAVLPAAAAAAMLASVLCASGTALAGPDPKTDATACIAPAEFTAVSVLTSSDAWAVGNCWTGSVPQGLIERWNGKRWAIVSSPSPGVGVDLEGVAAVSARYAWAVGGSAIEHWNGKKWSRSPEPVANISLRAVTAPSVSDAWAVGSLAESTSVSQTVILYWNGKHWRRVASPDPGGVNGVGYLDGVGGNSAGSVWAVGYYAKPAASVTDSLILRWNGRAWKQIPSPNPAGSDFTPLLGVSAVSNSDAWADGAADLGSETESVILRWNGKHWRQVPSPEPGGSQGTYLDGVVAVSKSAAWAVGDYGSPSAGLTLIDHWNGKYWRQVPSPSPGGDTNTNLLEAVAATPAGSAWAVGCYTSNSNCGTLAITYTRSGWRQVASAPAP